MASQQTCGPTLAFPAAARSLCTTSRWTGNSMPGIYSHLAQLIRDNRPAALATVVRGERSGAKLLISSEGVVAGSIDLQTDGIIAAVALNMLTGEVSETRTYDVDAEQIDVIIETFPPPQRLII